MLDPKRGKPPHTTCGAPVGRRRLGLVLASLALGLLGYPPWTPVEAQIPAQAPDSTGVYETARHRFRVVTVADGLEYPWSLAWLASGEMLVVERPGRVRVVRDGLLDPEPIGGWPLVYRDRGQGGFMDIVPHPDFHRNRWLYLSYGKPNVDGSEGALAVVRGRLEGGHVVDVEEIFVADAWHGNNNHFSGRMTFGADGHLFVAVGDRQYPPQLQYDHPAQDLRNHVGTIVRLTEHGGVPTENPYVGSNELRSEIFTWGHRNMQGLAADPLTGAIWSTEHGPRGGDELNLIDIPGGNYGWPVVSHGIDYDGSAFTLRETTLETEGPRHVWTPSIGVSGVMIYRGDRFPWWYGSAFVGGLAGERLVRVLLDGERAVGEEVMLQGQLGRVRDVREGPDGLIYLALERRDGPSKVVRLEPVPGEVQPPSR